MSVELKQKIDDFHNTQILLERENGQHLHVQDGRLQFRAKEASPLEKREVKAVVTSLLKRVQVGEGPLTPQNVHVFVFEKIFPLHHSICNPSAMQQNRALRSIIERRVAELKPEIERDINIVRCAERIRKIEEKIRAVQWQVYNPVHQLSNWSGWMLGRPTDTKLEKELEFLQWRATKEKRYCSLLSEALIGLKLGLSHETGAEKKGWSGSFFWKSYLDNRKIGVYKPSDQDSISPRSPHAFARFRLSFIPPTNGVIVSQSGKSHIAEAGARIVAERFHEAYMDMKQDGALTPFEEEDALVPDTRIVEMNFSSGPTEQGVGSFQLFLDQCQPLTEAFGIHKKTFQSLQGQEPREVNHLLPQYQWLKLLHYVLFAQDDHGENTMAIRSETGEITALKAIDNGQSFPSQPLEDSIIENHVLSMKPLFGLKHSLAKEKILPFFQAFIQKFLSDGYMDKLCQELRDFYQTPANYPDGKVEDLQVTEGRIRLIRKRFNVLEDLYCKDRQHLKLLRYFLKGDNVFD